MNAIDRIWTPEQIELAPKAEAWETDPWAAARLFDVELFTRDIVDPCCGTGILGDAARRAGYTVEEYDLYDWGRGQPGVDYLQSNVGFVGPGVSVIMNPPFSLATQFVEAALVRGARKVACFQRWAWWAESNKRREFWEAHPPSRIWACADRATCWLVTISPHDRMFTPEGKRRSNTPTPHAWYVFERHHRGPPVIGKIWKR